MIQQVCSADHDELSISKLSLCLSAVCKAEFEDSNYIAYEGDDDTVEVCVSLTCDYSSDAVVEVFDDRYYRTEFRASEGICTAIFLVLYFNKNIRLLSVV